MSATILLDAIITRVRSLFTPQQVAEVREYAGEFNAAEIAQLSFNSPAILISVLGWTNGKESKALGGARNTRLNQCVAFVITKDVRRDERMRKAAAITDALGYGLYTWSPDDHELCVIGGPEDEPDAENLFGRAVDEKGMALWVLSWEQATRPLVTPAAMFDLVAVEITSTATLSVDPEPGITLPLDVSEEIHFKTITS